ncbi:porin [Novosphingobium flavum]|uniref:Porin n=1 Tax=Novosphingobium flavum TaxID=1778672 RepID=A0A7X1KK03_9SPHN|nr:DcaP family trimeric outer membrane transporter [Novosphingobium flavum]MBC2664017.1 porin [Novosphingobium flavum]
MSRTALLVVLAGATALVAPHQARAATANEIALEARLERLEAEMAALQGELASARAEGTARLAALESKPPAEGLRDGNTTIRIGGYLKLLATQSAFSEGEVANNALGRDFYLPQQIPVGTGPSSRVQDFTAKQTRLWLNFASDVAGHAVRGYLETDFQAAAGTQGTQRTTNAYNLALRRAFLQIDRWTFGEDWTTFQYTGALPESTDYIGATEGTVFVRQPLIRYSAPLSKAVTLHLALENPESGTISAGTGTMVENGKDHMPDLAARLVWSEGRAELSLGLLARQVRTESAAGISATAGGYGASLGGRLFLNGKKSADLRFMATYGRNIGRYVGLNFAPDAVYVAASNRLEHVDVLAALAALRVPLAARLRLNLIGSYQSVAYADGLAPAAISGMNKRAFSGAVNLFYSPVNNIDLGLEYRHGEREVVSGASGALDRIEFAAKYNF